MSSSEFIASDAEVRKAAVSMLRSLDLTALPPQKLKRYYYDTPDARLFKAGLRLTLELFDDASRLALTQVDSGRTLAVLAQEEVPRFADDLPDSALRRLLYPITEMRALVARAAFSIERETYLQRDSRNKTLATVLVEQCRAVGSKATLPTLIRVDGVRGYASVSERLRQRMVEAGLTPAAEDNFARLLRARAQQAALVAEAEAPQIVPEMRADAAVKRILLRLLDQMQANEAGLLAQTDTEFLHDYRVALRKSRSLIGKAKHVLPEATRQRLKQQLRELGVATTTARDMDVYLLNLPRFQKQLPKSMHQALLPFRDFLAQHQAQEYQLLSARLRSPEYKRFVTSYRRFLEAPVPQRPAATQARKPARAYAAAGISRLYAQILRDGAGIDISTPDEELHQLRVECKKLRYLMEFFAPLFDKSVVRELVPRLKGLQSTLGDFQDCVVQQQRLMQFEMNMAAEGELPAATREAMEWLIRKLAARYGAIRAEFGGRFKRFSSKKVRRQFAQQFGS